MWAGSMDTLLSVIVCKGNVIIREFFSMHFTNAYVLFSQLKCYQSFPWFSYEIQIELCCLPASNRLLDQSAYIMDLLCTSHSLYLLKGVLFSHISYMLMHFIHVLICKHPGLYNWRPHRVPLGRHYFSLTF